jgi:aryl-alcohol dehydrogenase-like predicted oxidoreductase
VWGNRDHEDCIRLIHAALDAGLTTFDTAASYSQGESEEIVGRAIRGRRDKIVLSTKYGYDTGTAGAVGIRQGLLVRALEDSLLRLATDYVDLFFVHRIGQSDHLEAIVQELTSLVEAGKAREVGTSMASAEQLLEIDRLVQSQQPTWTTWEQLPYSIFVRTAEEEILPTCHRLGIRVAAFAPLNGGWLTGQYRAGHDVPMGSRAANWPLRRERFDFGRPEVERKIDLIPALERLAADTGQTLVELALGFALSRRDIAAVIVGPRTPEQLQLMLSGPPRPLGPEVLAAIDVVVPPGTATDPADILGYHQTSSPIPRG